MFIFHKHTSSRADSLSVRHCKRRLNKTGLNNILISTLIVECSSHDVAIFAAEYGDALFVTRKKLELVKPMGYGPATVTKVVKVEKEPEHVKTIGHGQTTVTKAVTALDTESENDSKAKKISAIKAIITQPHLSISEKLIKGSLKSKFIDILGKTFFTSLFRS